MLKSIAKRLQADEKGFTLIELMVVVVIIGILAAVVIPQFSNSTDKARNKAALSELRTFQNAVEIYYAEYGIYPSDDTDVENILGLNGIDWPKNDPWNSQYDYSDDDNNPYFFTGGNGPSPALSSSDL